MKGTEHFIIKSYLDQRAKEDELFRAKYETTARTIDDVVTFILHEVKNSGCCGFSDSEIYSMAVHAIDEPDLEIGKPLQCSVVVNHKVGTEGTRAQTLSGRGAAQDTGTQCEAESPQAATGEPTDIITL